MSQQEKLAEGLKQLGLDLTPEVQAQLLKFVVLLHKWNKVHNLTAIREPLKMITHHLLDSLAVLPYISGDRLVDVGSGGGLPGIPLAIEKPGLAITLLDSNHKKTGFMRQAVIDLGLKNVEVVGERVEQFHPEQPFDIVISRAFSDLAEFVKLTRHLLATGGRFLAMKGVYPYEEIVALPPDVKVEEVISLEVPELGAKRHLVVMRVLT
jgi:16S rRNA (guanine527-N7)-methyltransferase